MNIAIGLYDLTSIIRVHNIKCKTYVNHRTATSQLADLVKIDGITVGLQQSSCVQTRLTAVSVYCRQERLHGIYVTNLLLNAA